MGRACLPLEINLGSPRVHAFDESMQEQLRGIDVDLVDERRWRAAIRNTHYNQELRRYHQRFVHSRELRAEDLVLRRILNREGLHKLSLLPIYHCAPQYTDATKLHGDTS